MRRSNGLPFASPNGLYNLSRLSVSWLRLGIAIERIKPSPDAYCPGLYLVVQPSGVKSWAVRYRHAGRTCKFTLGPFPAIDLKAARDAGKLALRAVSEGRNPAAEKTKPVVANDDVESVVEQFIQRHIVRNYRPKPRKDAERYLRKYVVEKWGGRKISDIGRDDIRDLLELLVDDAPIAANRLHSIVRTFFGWALEHDIIAASPCARLKRPVRKEGTRDRVLSDGELRRVWLAAGKMGFPYGTVVQLCILTGQRRGEVAGMRWDSSTLHNAFGRCLPSG